MAIFLLNDISRNRLKKAVFGVVSGVSLYGVMMHSAYTQTQNTREMMEADDQPKSILFPAGVPGPYFPSDDDIVRQAEETLNQVSENPEEGTVRTDLPDDDIDVSEINNEDGVSYGTLGQNQSGLTKTIWQPSELEKIEHLLMALNLPSTSPAMNDIARNLLLAVSSPPTGEPIVDPSFSFSGNETQTGRENQFPEQQVIDPELTKAFINLRLKKLTERGNLSDLVGFIQNLPDGMLEPDKRNAEILMLGGDLIGACQMTRDARQENTDMRTPQNRFPAPASGEADNDNVFWLKMLAFCRTLEGDNSGAQIAIDMLNEQGNVDFVFSDLIERLSANAGTTGSFLSRGLTSLEPLNYIILSLLDQPIDADLIETSSPLVTSALVINPNMSPESRFQAAVKSYSYGGVSPDILRNIYGLQEFTDMEYNNAVRMAEFDERPVADALLYQAASKQATDIGKAQILDIIWKRARQGNDMPRRAALNIETLLSLNPSDRLINHAHHITRGLVLGGEIERAKQWYDFVRRNAAGGDAEATRALINIWPLIILSAERGQIPWSDNILDLWWNGQMVLSPENRDSRATLFYAIAEAFGYPVSEQKWEELITENRSDKVRSIPLAVWRELIRSVGENKQGQAIILGLIAMGKDGPGALDPSGISTIIRMLRSFGMEAEARDVAIEALVANDF